MSAKNTASGSDSSKVYHFVINNVVSRLKDEFAALNVDESVLLELRSRWEEKLFQQGLINHSSSSTELSGQPGLRNDAYPAKAEANEEVAIEATGKRGYAGEHYGAPGAKHARTDDDAPPVSSYLPQHDGPGDEYGAHVTSGSTPSSQSNAEDEVEAKQNREESAEDAELGDNADGGSDDSDDEEEEEEEVENLLVGQFEKVTRVKLRWRVVMKDCVFHLGGKDYLVKKCAGDYLWM